MEGGRICSTSVDVRVAFLLTGQHLVVAGLPKSSDVGKHLREQTQVQDVPYFIILL